MSGATVVPLPRQTAADEWRSTQAEPVGATLRTAVTSESTLSDADRAAWRELLAFHPDSAPFVDQDWVAAWSAAFRPREAFLVRAWEGNHLVGLGALQGVIEPWAGRPAAVLQSLTSVESFRFEFLSSRGRSDVQERLFMALCDAGRWAVIRLEYLPEDSPTIRAGLNVAAELGWKQVLEETLESPWRTLPRPPAAWDAGLKRKFKSNLRNRERRLENLGAVDFTVAEAGDRQEAALEAFYALEASGWKGERGTAIAQRTSVKAFYDGLIERTAQKLWIPVLSVAGRPAAAQLIRVHGRTLFLLKTAYHPDFAPYAPGQLITARLIRYGVARGMETLDFLGQDMTWKRDWEPRLRSHYHLMLFAPSFGGRYAYWSRYGIREVVKKIPGARRLARELRARWRRA